MNLTPAEVFAKQAWDARLVCDCPKEQIESFIRQIQADALRWALDMISSDVNTPNSRAIREKADQLHPKS